MTRPPPRSPGIRSLLAGAPRESLLAVLGRGMFLIVVEFFAVTVVGMYMPPHISTLNSRERQRDMLAQADRQRLARQLSDLAPASRRVQGTARGQRRTRRTVAALTRLIPRYRAVR
jgi:hypothetical protein